MSGFWESNLTLLSRRSDPPSKRLAAEMIPLGPAPEGPRNRDGVPLPWLEAGGRVRALVSAYDAAKEAQRWASEFPGGTAAVFGGAGTAAADALAAQGAVLIFWIEPRAEVWRSLFTWEDWTPWLGWDQWVPITGNAASWGQVLSGRYHPLWDGAFRTVEWRSAVQGFEGLWDGHRRATVETLAAAASDASTQARFGERWYRNTLVNLQRLPAGRIPSCPGATVVIAGAGPGLEDALENPASLRWLEDRPRTGDRLFSTDTALPALTCRGIVPDLVLCLDGQLPTYHHFVSPPPPVPLVADLASIPFLGRLAMPQVRFLSGHPFGAVVRQFFPDLPSLDGSLGNVSGLGLMAARALGARRVETWGVGFSYRDGKSYARGTYVYDLSARRADRLSPGETRLGASCYGAAGLERTKDDRGHFLDTTPLLRDYRRRWDAAPDRVPPVLLEHQAAGDRWEAFSASWRYRLETLPLPPPGAPVQPFVRSLDPARQTDWRALWPLALALHRQGVDSLRLPRVAVERALSFLQEPLKIDF